MSPLPKVFGLVWCCCALLTGGDALAAAVVRSDFVTHSWGTAQGMPQSAVTTILQTSDGYLWVGTYNGLARFDGVRFTVFDNFNTPELRDCSVTCLFEDNDRVLWIGHSNGELTRLQNGRFQAVELKKPFGEGGLRGLGADQSGDLWVCSDDCQLERVRDGLLLTAQRGPLTRQSQFVRSDTGAIWVDYDGCLSCLTNGQLVVVSPVSASASCSGLGPSSDGGFWAVWGGALHKWTNGVWSDSLGPVPSGGMAFDRMLESKNGWLVAATSENGFFLFQPGKGEEGIQFCRTNAFSSDWITALCEDFEGDLWVGTGGAGLQVVRRAKVRTVSPPDDWQGRAVLSVSPSHDGGLWIGSEGAGLYRFCEGKWQNYGTSAGLRSLYVWSAVEDSHSDLWVGTWGEGLFRGSNGNFVPAPGLSGALPPMTAILCALQGGLWVGTQAGLLRYQDSSPNWLGRRDRFGGGAVKAVLEDRDGALWYGTAGGGLGYLKDGAGRRFRQQDGLSSDYITCLHRDAGGVLWIGTSAGLTRMKEGRFATLNREKGLPNDHIVHIEEDALGFLWMSSRGGIIRARRGDLESCADGQTARLYFQAYGLSDGMPTLECSDGSQPAGCKSADGMLWFATRKGLVTIDPMSVKLNLWRPPVVIESLSIDDHQITRLSDSTAPLRIPPGSHRLDFAFTGLSFAAPEKVRFAYSLEGLNDKWVQAGSRRTAEYSYLPPGSYVFKVIACNNDGLWNETGARFAFVIAPFFWQTLWFRILVIAGLAAFAGGISWFELRRRMRRKIEQLEQQRALDRERARIARDIHDDLGASLTRITMLSDSARNDLQNPSRAAAELDRIYLTARALTRAMDEIVWAVNPKHDTLDSLMSYLSKYAQDFVRAAGIRCHFDVPVDLPAWPVMAEVRHNLFLAAKECLNNVAKHAGASEVWIKLCLEPAGFTVTIHDNGRGFSPDPETAPSPDRINQGNGLPNMRRRLLDVGGCCEIQSTPGEGTTVKLKVILKSLSPRPIN